ncbi:MAG TPA: acyl-CoA dehydrogenase family protein, partial [Mycobacteriales bacterium]|nr:acyl-CoA dehydrogenase family protein [Mycobacteriales bacterium]
MDLDFSVEQKEFRDQVRTWLAENAPRERRPDDAAGIRAYDLAWQRAQWEGGWAGVSWPTEFGGRGLSLMEQLIWFEEYGRVGLPGIDACFVGLNHAGPTLISCATQQQKQKHLPEILRGDVVWCQGFSEPNAGSDLASLRTHAVRDGDELVVTGQKIWTSYAQVADWQELLVRTDSTGAKHQGITWVICDMHSPGIEVRPIETMERGAEFCEVFYDEVRIPVGNVVGEIDDGWRVAMSTLAFERGTAFTANQVRLETTVERLIEFAREHRDSRGGATLDDTDVARRLASARAAVASLRAMTYLGISRTARAGAPGPAGSMLKVFYADLVKEVGQLGMDILGSDALRYSSRWDPDGWSGGYLHSFSQSIGGGTTEIQRNIVAERVLGLP